MMSDNDKKKLKSMVTEIANAMTRIADERSFIKDVKDRAKEELDMDAKTLNTIAKIYYSNTLIEERMSAEQIFDTYEEVFGSSNTVSTSGQ